MFQNVLDTSNSNAFESELNQSMKHMTNVASGRTVIGYHEFAGWTLSFQRSKA